MDCYALCSRVEPHEFKNYLNIKILYNEIDRGLLREYAERKCNFVVVSNRLTQQDINDIVDRITDYTYGLYRQVNIIEEQEYSEHSIEEDMVRILETFRNPQEREPIDPANMSASLEADLSSAVLFYDMMMEINSRNQLEQQNQSHNIEVVSIEIEEKVRKIELQECTICYETDSKINFVKLNCQHEICKNCIKSWISKNKNKSCCPFCREKIIKINTKTQQVRNEIL